MAAKITEFVFNDGEYFTAKLDTGDVRIGFTGCECFDIPKGHAWFDRIAEAESRTEVEGYHDELMSAFA